MKTVFAPFQQKRLRICGILAAGAMAAGSLSAQSPAPRIRTEISSSATSIIKGSLHPLAQQRNDVGRMPADTRLTGISIYFNRSAAQQADLQALLAAQQDPSSPQYHQWLTPDQFAARFGMAQSDIDAVEAWLQQQGFSIDSVARSRNMIRFSGTAGPGGAGLLHPDALLQGCGREALRARNGPFGSISGSACWLRAFAT